MLWHYVEMRVCIKKLHAVCFYFSTTFWSHSYLTQQPSKPTAMHLGRIGLPNPVNLIGLPSGLFIFFVGSSTPPTLSFVLSKNLRPCFLVFIKKKHLKNITYLITIYNLEKHEIYTLSQSVKPY